MQETVPSTPDPAADSVSPVGKLDLVAAKSFHAEMLDRSGGDIRLDLSGVTLLGALCAQICLATAQSLQRAGHTLTITDISEAAQAHLASMGLSPEKLCAGAP